MNIEKYITSDSLMANSWDFFLWCENQMSKIRPSSISSQKAVFCRLASLGLNQTLCVCVCVFRTAKHRKVHPVFNVMFHTKTPEKKEYVSSVF